MAIAEMSKLRLIGLFAEKDVILNALARTGCAEIKECPAPENTAFRSSSEGLTLLSEKRMRAEGCILAVSNAVDAYVKTNKTECEYSLNGFGVSFDKFIAAGDTEAEMLSLCDEADALTQKISDAQNGVIRMRARLKSLAPYAPVKETFASLSDTKFAAVFLGTVPEDKLPAFKEYAENAEAADYEEWEPVGGAVTVLLAAHKTVADEALSSILALGFQRCPFAGEFTAAQLISECNGEIRNYEAERARAEEKLLSLGARLKELKTYSDYLKFEIEKLEASEKFPGTRRAFVLEAYVPKEAQEKVLSALKSVSENIYSEFAAIDAAEMPPTLMKNNKVVRNFEFVTNMYTPPNYREFDPNAVMSVFFSIFLGFIMADIGYGIIMTAGGFIMAKMKKGGIARLANVIGIGGIFTVIFGVLFGSFFGINLPFLAFAPLKDIEKTVLLAGNIALPLILLIALLMGVVQLMASNLCRAYAEFRYGRVADGIFFGVIWAVFLAGVMMLVLGLTEDFGMGYLTMPGAVTAAASVLIGAATAGLRVRGFGKVTKGFGALYGIINYFSDILSYSRLYGLMLSGAIIAQIVSDNSLNLINSGNAALAILGVIIMIIGHAFNLAIGLLGGYIHDARLQYIEFFSRFYGGEGELFAPIGSAHDYVSVNAETP